MQKKIHKVISSIKGVRIKIWNGNYHSFYIFSSLRASQEPLLLPTLITSGAVRPALLALGQIYSHRD